LWWGLAVGIRGAGASLWSWSRFDFSVKSRSLAGRIELYIIISAVKAVSLLCRRWADTQYKSRQTSKLHARGAADHVRCAIAHRYCLSCHRSFEILLSHSPQKAKLVTRSCFVELAETVRLPFRCAGRRLGSLAPPTLTKPQSPAKANVCLSCLFYSFIQDMVPSMVA